MKELDTTVFQRPFILNEHLNDPNDVTERLRKSVRAHKIDQAIRQMFAESPATMLEVRSTRKYTEFRSDCRALISIIRLFMKVEEFTPIDGATLPVGTQYSLICARIAEFNYILTK